MSMIIRENSATLQQAYNLTLAFQRTLGFGLPQQVTTEPTVKVAGSRFDWTSPGLKVKHAAALLAEYDRLERGVFDGPTADPQRTVPLFTVESVISGLMSETGENGEYDRACIEIASDLGMTLVPNPPAEQTCVYEHDGYGECSWLGGGGVRNDSPVCNQHLNHPSKKVCNQHGGEWGGDSTCPECTYEDGSVRP